jgi:hypothetical protein
VTPEVHSRLIGLPMPFVIFAWGVVVVTGGVKPEWLGCTTPFELFWQFAIVAFLIGGALTVFLAVVVPTRCPKCRRYAARMRLATTIRYTCSRCRSVHDTGVETSDGNAFEGPGIIP